ncbi:hypothetical protein C8035_v006694 [Colletotrichum spinosum]|uniref:Uncharacterized protein n=1 Tax=Colletotrichum spinosum TaxID=1347390 RepID=A0A4R8PYL4_9PEZI|nr:hypothetical protein C8035_v006694 [Colletotrichum spinosum]
MQGHMESDTPLSALAKLYIQSSIDRPLPSHDARPMTPEHYDVEMKTTDQTSGILVTHRGNSGTNTMAKYHRPLTTRGQTGEEDQGLLPFCSTAPTGPGSEAAKQTIPHLISHTASSSRPPIHALARTHRPLAVL